MGRILGLDVGDRTIGVAVSDELALTAQGVTVCQRQSLAADLRYLGQLVHQFAAETIVVGLPKRMDGSLGPQAQKTAAFIEQLRHTSGIPVIVWDERLTTRQAERVLLIGDASRKRRKQVRDQLAAQLILQAYLDWLSHHPASGVPRPSETGLSMGFPPEDVKAEGKNRQMREPDGHR